MGGHGRIRKVRCEGRKDPCEVQVDGLNADRGYQTNDIPCTDTTLAGPPPEPPHQLYHPDNSEATTPRRVNIIIQEAVRL